MAMKILYNSCGFYIACIRQLVQVSIFAWLCVYSPYLKVLSHRYLWTPKIIDIIHGTGLETNHVRLLVLLFRQFVSSNINLFVEYY